MSMNASCRGNFGPGIKMVQQAKIPEIMVTLEQLYTEKMVQVCRYTIRVYKLFRLTRAFICIHGLSLELKVPGISALRTKF